jgi:hypothetical protein
VTELGGDEWIRIAAQLGPGAGNVAES